jgi:hypothetical protein
MSPPTEVLYITGSGRSGSTMLSRLLGEVDGVVNVGEAASHYFKKSTPVPCGCGASVRDCLFWKRIPINRRAQEFGHQFLRIRHITKLALADHTSGSKVRNLVLSMHDLYRTIAEKTGARVVVDTSKNPAVAYALSRTPGVRLSVIHLIRAPQGVADSWRRPKGYLSPAPAWRVSLKWTLVNPFAELIAGWQPAHHWTIRYEDLTENPRMFVEAIAAAVLGGPADCSFLQGNRAAVRAQHILAGNPDKLERSDVVIEKRHPVLPRRTSFVVSLLTFPLTLRYGYIWPCTPWLAPVRLSFAYDFQKRRDIPLSSGRQTASLPRL